MIGRISAAAIRSFACVLVLWAATSTVTTAASSPSAWEKLAQEFIEATFAIDPVRAVREGRHEHDGELPDLSAAGITAQIEHYRAWRERARAFDPTELSRRDAFERELLVWHCDSQLFWLETARWPFRNPEFYSGYLSPSVYVTRPYASKSVRLAALTRYASAIPEALAQVRANLAGDLPRPYVERAIGFFGGLARHLADEVPPLFADVDDAELQRDFTAANARAAAAFRDAAAWLQAKLPTPYGEYAMGAALFSEMLARTELIDTPLAELETRNDRDLARNRAALDAACRVLHPNPDAAFSTAACVARVDAEKPAHGPVARGTEQLVALRRFVVEHDLVSVPLPDEARVAEAPPYRRANLAYIERPGRYEKVQLPSVYYISPPDPSWTAEEQRAYLPSEANLLFVSSHEVWPGHFLHGLHRRAHAGPLGGLLGSYAFTEGWAHYAEEMMWDAGLGNADPKLHVGQLVSALWRNVRFRSAIGLHTKGMTVAESERLFREEAFLDPGNARQQAARGTYDPGYLAYTLGKLQILELRDAWIARRGGRAAWKAFHDELLSWGAPPLPLLARYMEAGGRN